MNLLPKSRSAESKNSTDIKLGLILNASFTVVEFIFGLLTGSLALIADATHNLTDTFTLSVSFVADRFAGRKANSSKTFGYGRATILAALLNSSVMLAVAILIIVESVRRFGSPHTINGITVAIVASLGIVINGSIALILSKRRSDLNIRSAYTDMIFDALSSIGTVIAGLLIMFTSINGIDSLVGLLIAILLIYNTLRILAEAVQILLEGTPKDVNLGSLASAINSITDVVNVDDLHVWSIKSGYNALSCHIVIDEKDLPKSRKIVERIKSELEEKYSIHHATIEVELEDCSKQHTHIQH